MQNNQGLEKELLMECLVQVFSALFGMKLPGPGCVYVSQSIKFRKPVYVGDTVTAYIEVKDVDLNRRRVYFDTYCKVGNSKVITGSAEIYIPE